jgi:adenosylcobalamin-dependent ribonucleoside-triphosphate reductase
MLIKNKKETSMPDSGNVTALSNFRARRLHPGMGQAVAERTILRKKENGKFETWGNVAKRVAYGNAALVPNVKDFQDEHQLLHKHIAHASLLMSGRHLQHGDETQPERPKEVFTNCATSSTSFLLFLLLLSGSGVGRSYDDDLILVDWDNAPTLRCVLDESHADFDWSAHESVRDALHKYGPDSKTVMWYKVPDTREGWATALEIWENAAFQKIHKDKMLILDFSDIRAKGSPIKGVQNRPASGPVPTMNAFMKASSIKGCGMAPWKQAMYIDHYMAECVLVGGARRAARMATKYWKDETVLDFIRIKRPIEFDNMNIAQVEDYRKNNSSVFSFLWSSNNSVCVDEEFWQLLDTKRRTPEYSKPLAKHARKVWRALTQSSYGDGTGEPGIINVDKLHMNNEGWEELASGDYVGSKKFQIQEETELYLQRLAKRAKKKKYNMITNPCGEIALNVLGGYCVIADVVPYHTNDLEEAEEAFRVATRALIRVNLMDSIYKKEDLRTNRIGVGMTGVHEFAWKFFKVGFRSLVNPDFGGLNGGDGSKSENPHVRAAAFWRMLSHFNAAVKDEAKCYSKKLGLVTPHTSLTIKPAGTTSKLFGLTEGWHLPSMEFYLRWVQFKEDDPLVAVYKEAGYPVKELKTYSHTVIVGFPTAPVIAELGLGEELVTATEATPEEQYKWLQLGEKYWIIGEGEDKGNQISYTLKYDPEKVDYKHFSDMLKEWQSQIKVCSVLPTANTSAYEYLPEQSITKVEFEAIVHEIKEMEVEEDVDMEELTQCEKCLVMI